LKSLTKFGISLAICSKNDEKIEIYQDWDSLKTILFIKKVESKFDIKIKEINYFSLTLKQIINMI
jgi:acyl carrier protein